MNITMDIMNAIKWLKSLVEGIFTFAVIILALCILGLGVGGMLAAIYKIIEVLLS